ATQTHHHGHAFILEEFIDAALELLLGIWTSAVRPAPASPAAQRSRTRRTPATAAIRGETQLGQLLVGVSLAERCSNHGQLAATAHEQDLALQPAPVLVEIGLGSDV